jgi:hypothetical protein
MQHKGNFDKKIHIDDDSLADLKWWIEILPSAKALINMPNPNFDIQTDASSYGWGATTNDGRRVSGHFTQQESTLHINEKEILAVEFSLKSLFQDVTNCHIRIESDNSTTVIATNKMGSTRARSVDVLVRRLWDWAITRGIWISVTHIPGRLNADADEESRREFSGKEWMLNTSSFQEVTKMLNFSPTVDLFASRLNKQLPSFFSFGPDPECMGVNSFTVSWKNLQFYAFPPFAIIGKVLQKLEADEATGIVVVPDWPTQCWFKKFVSLRVKDVVLPPRSNLLNNPMKPTERHPLYKTLALRVGVLCGKR